MPHCQCSALFVGKHCETKAKEMTDSGQYVEIGTNFTHFVFQPEKPDQYKFTFETCMLKNPEYLESLIFITSDQDDGSQNYEPSIFSSAKVRVKEGNCISFTSPFIEIRKDVAQPFWRIIIGMKAIPKAFKNYFYRTVPGKKLGPVPQELLDE